MSTEINLFTTEVGSRMWGMEDLSSDYDLVTVYAVPTDDILMGYGLPTGKRQQKYMDGDKEIDHQYIEVGHLINLLCKGNVNAIWIATSPLIHYVNGRYTFTVKEDTSDIPMIDAYSNRSFHGYLYRLVIKSLSKSSYNSIKGMAQSQYNDVVKRANIRDPNKSRMTALRTLSFGSHLLCCNDVNYKVYDPSKAKRVATDKDVECALELLDQHYYISTLPDRPNEVGMRRLLKYLRLKLLYGDHY